MKIELKNVKFSESLSEETNAFTADIFVDGKKCGFAKNDGQGGCTDIRQIGGTNSKLFVECVNWLKTQPDINIGSETEPYMINCHIESMVDHLFDQWLKDKEVKKMEKKMLTHVMWGVPNSLSYRVVKFNKPLNTIDHNVLQKYLDTWKATFIRGEQFLNTNLEGFNL